jgi:hypothetical protein
MSAKRPAESLSKAEKSNERVHVGKRGPEGAHAKLKRGKAGGASAPGTPKSESITLKRMHSRGLSTASGVDSSEDEDDSRVCVWRRANRGGVCGAMERAANWLVGIP